MYWEDFFSMRQKKILIACLKVGFYQYLTNQVLSKILFIYFEASPLHWQRAPCRPRRRPPHSPGKPPGEHGGNGLRAFHRVDGVAQVLPVKPDVSIMAVLCHFHRLPHLLLRQLCIEREEILLQPERAAAQGVCRIL
jgi:hypothetical protein